MGQDPTEELPPPPSVSELLLFVLDAATETIFTRPVRPRMKVSPQGLLRGRIDVLKIEVPALSISGLVVDRFVVRAENVRIAPGIPPRLQAGPVGFKAVLSQDNVDRWTRTSRLPLRLRLTEEGIVSSTGLRGIKVSEVASELDVVGPMVRLRPTKATMLGVSTPLVKLFRGYLPLPPLPRGARLESVEHADGELAAAFRIDEVDEPLSPDIASRLRRVLQRR